MKRVLVYFTFFMVSTVLFYAFRLYKIDGTSMNYGLIEGDMVLCQRQADDIKRGDMLVVRHPLDPKGRLYLKRCAALGGDRFFQEKRFFFLQIESNSSKTFQLALKYDLEAVSTPQGYFLKNPYLKYYGVVHNRKLRVPTELTKISLTSVPPKHYYMLGDYRDNSADSRFFGAVPRSWVMSKVIYVFKRSRDWISLLKIKEADEKHEDFSAIKQTGQSALGEE